MSSGSETLLNREKHNQLVHNMEILDRSKWPKETDICFRDKQVCKLAKELDVCVSIQSMDSVNTLLVGIVNNFPSTFQPLAAAVKRL
jgi:hypothetical protein